MHFSCASACILPLCHLHGPDVAGGTGNAQMHRTCSAGTFEYDPESKPPQVDMSDNTNIANVNGPSMTGSSVFGKIKNSFVGLLVYAETSQHAPDIHLQPASLPPQMSLQYPNIKPQVAIAGAQPPKPPPEIRGLRPPAAP